MASMRRVISILVFALMAVASGYAIERGKAFNPLSDKLYAAYLVDDFKVWKGVIDNFHKNQRMSVDSLDYLLEVQYCYLGWAVTGDTVKAGAEKYLKKALADLERYNALIDQLPDKSYTREYMEAKAKSFESAFLAYQMVLAPVKVIVNGWKCVNNAKSAINEMPECWFSQIEYGNVMQAMPTVLGGSNINALKAYLRAQKLMEADQNIYTTYHNWLYMHLLLCIADCYKASEDYKKVREYYNKLLTIEPSYGYVKNSLLPSLDKYEAQQKKKIKLK